VLLNKIADYLMDNVSNLSSARNIADTEGIKIVDIAQWLIETA
jgi:hypothetical protein